jgi:hypothetical protein
VAHDGSVSIICRVTTGALPMSELGQQRRASASALTKLRQVLSQSCRAINAFGSLRATLIGLSNQETDTSHVWSIRTKLQLEGRTRDLALFNLAIDSKLRGCDVVAVRVDDVTPRGYTLDRATVRQKKTGRPVRFELTEVSTQQSGKVSTDREIPAKSLK